jgi:hypothetical protein
MDDVTEKLPEIAELFHRKTQAPSEYASICFEDFVLYSRACKKMVKGLNELYAPTARQVAAFLQRTKGTLLADQRGKPTRDLITAFLRTEFSIDDKGAQDAKVALHVGPAVGRPPP